jgi:plasmid stabilization system protein ParE
MAGIRFHPDAVHELEESADWYLARSRSAAQGFALAVESALKSIEHDPKRFPKVDARHRSCSIPKFPFQIIFRMHGGLVHVIAVAHLKRRPGYWRRRR